MMGGIQAAPDLVRHVTPTSIDDTIGEPRPPHAAIPVHMASARSISASGKRALVTEPARGWIVAIARLGYAAKAVVYATIGVIAALAAAHLGEQASGSQGAFVALMLQPFGHVLLGMLSVGLACYGL